MSDYLTLRASDFCSIEPWIAEAISGRPAAELKRVVLYALPKDALLPGDIATSPIPLSHRLQTQLMRLRCNGRCSYSSTRYCWFHSGSPITGAAAEESGADAASDEASVLPSE